jgi:hypothetical protein
MTRRWLRAPLLAVTLLFLLPVPVLGARNTLSNPTVSPLSGTPSTTFTYTVHYKGAPASVTASVAGRTLPMGVASGTDSNGTFAVSTTLPVGSWPVTFRAVAQGNDDTLAGPTVTVTSTATPRPTTGPTPPPATPPPLPTPPPTPQPPPITATPLQATPLPSITPSPEGSGPGASGFIGGFIRTPVPTPTPAAVAAVEEPGGGDGIWTLVTGGLIALSALALLGMVGILRTRRPEPVDQPIGPVEFRPPTEDE